MIDLWYTHKSPNTHSEHFINLTGRGHTHLAVIDEDGSPQAARAFGLWHPAGTTTTPEQGQGEEGDGVIALRKRSPYRDTAQLLAALVQRGLKTLVFVKVCVCLFWEVYSYPSGRLALAPSTNHTINQCFSLVLGKVHRRASGANGARAAAGGAAGRSGGLQVRGYISMCVL